MSIRKAKIQYDWEHALNSNVRDAFVKLEKDLGKTYAYLPPTLFAIFSPLNLRLNDREMIMIQQDNFW